jgi:hypothetical protein
VPCGAPRPSIRLEPEGSSPRTVAVALLLVSVTDGDPTDRSFYSPSGSKGAPRSHSPSLIPGFGVIVAEEAGQVQLKGRVVHDVGNSWADPCIRVFPVGALLR